MRNAILVLLLLAAAIGLWWVAEREPNLSAGQAQLDAERAAREAAVVAEAEATAPAAEASAAERDPYETVDDPAYVEARAQRDVRLKEIAEEAERRRQRAGDDIATGSGGGGGGGGGGPRETDVVDPEPEPVEEVIEDDPQTQAAQYAELLDEAADIARERGLVPDSLLDKLSFEEQQEMLGDHYIFDEKLREKFGVPVPLSDRNRSGIILNVIGDLSKDEKGDIFRDHLHR